MNIKEAFTKIKEVELPEGSYVVFGSFPLAVAGIRETYDIDIFVSEEEFQKLRESGWQVVHKENSGAFLAYDIFEAFKSWNTNTYNPTFTEVLSGATLIEGIRVASLEEVLKWKKAFSRPKDLADVKVIEEYLSNKKD